MYFSADFKRFFFHNKNAFYLLRGNFYHSVILCKSHIRIVCQCRRFQIGEQSHVFFAFYISLQRFFKIQFITKSYQFGKNDIIGYFACRDFATSADARNFKKIFSARQSKKINIL